MVFTERARITTECLDPVTIENLVAGDHFGARVNFKGVVRNHDVEAMGRVVELSYTAHPDAELILQEIVDSFARGPEDRMGEVRVAAHHRIGKLSVGDIALVVGVASAHRAEAFDVCRAVIEAIKLRVPIWKKQLTADGAHSWVGL